MGAVDTAKDGREQKLRRHGGDKFSSPRGKKHFSQLAA